MNLLRSGALLLALVLLEPSAGYGRMPAAATDFPTLNARESAALGAAARNPGLPEWQQEVMTRLAAGDRPAADGRWDGRAASVPTPLVGPGEETWSALTGSPKGHMGSTAIYDPTGARLIVFGGMYMSEYHNEAWSLTLSDPPTWAPIVPAGPLPPARYGHTAIYDPVGQRMVVFGGAAAWYFGDAWALSLSGTPAWTELTPPGPLPPARTLHSAIYDPVSERMVIFGGLSTPSPNDVWALSLSGPPAWADLTPAATGPSARFGHSAVYDPGGVRMIVFGGSTSGGNSNQVWALSLGASPAWTPLAPAGSLPPARWGHAALFDAAAQRMVVFGGYAGITNYFNDVWALDLQAAPAWTPLAPSGAPPAARYLSAAALDPVGRRMLVVSGYRNLGTNEYLDDAWELPLGATPAWRNLQVSHAAPGAFYDHVGVYDATGKRLVIFGLSRTTLENEAWVLPLADAPVWSRLATTGPVPAAGSGGAAIYDPVGQRLLCFGGQPYNNELWALALDGPPAWSLLSPTGTPPGARSDATAIYDPVGVRMILFGGRTSGGQRLDDVWELALGGTPAWANITPGAPGPVGRYGHIAVYDAGGRRMITTGGFRADGLASGDVWALSLEGPAAWSALPATNTPFLRLVKPAAIADPYGPRLVVSVGDQTWALNLEGPAAWSVLPTQGMVARKRGQGVAIYDPVQARMVLQGGLTWSDATTSGELDDTWALALSQPESGAPIEPPVASLELRAEPNPFSRDTTARFVLSRGMPLEIGIYDVVGRRVRSLAAGVFSTGPHEARWDGRDDHGRIAVGGVYFLRVAGAEFERVVKVVRRS